MKLAKLLFARVFVANLLQLIASMDNSTIAEPPPGPPSCTSRCMVDSMFVTQCLDTRCLCNEKDYQKSLFQCLYSQCDSDQYGPALSHSISLCMSLGAEIYMVAPGVVDNELLRSREEDYLAGREVANVPGLHLRQESIGFGQTTTVTSTVTSFVTMSYSLITFTPTPSALLETSQGPEVTTTSASRPWVIPVSPGGHTEPSFFGLVVWVSLVLFLDYWMNGYWYWN
ncbi:hypothetical protein F4804DRAFT_330738 [Jackrogersella minutella]|nr:hypothetical protein F4804DRAFT_330738 [Jackrogersella minutella]